MTRVRKQKPTPWHTGKMREDLFSFKVGDRVVFKRSLEPVPTGIGTCYWIMSEKNLIRVAESYGGEGMEDLIRVTKDKETGKPIEAPLRVHKNYNKRAIRIQAAKNRPRPRKDLFLKETPVRASPLF